MAVHRDSEGRWFFRVWAKDADGRRVRLFGTPKSWGLPRTQTGTKEAERRAIVEAAGKSARHDAVNQSPAAAEAPTLNGYIETYIAVVKAKKNKPATIASKRQIFRDHLQPVFGHVRLDKITDRMIQDVDVELADEVSDKTRNNIWSVMRHVFKIAIKRADLDKAPEVPWVVIGKAHEFDFFTFEEADALVEAALAEPAWHAMILLALRTGLRQGELLGLQWGDVDVRAGRMNIRRAVSRGIVGTPKNGKGRAIALSDEALALLEAHRRRISSLWVFSDGAGGRLTSGECKHPLWRTCKAAGLRRVGWHVLRHTFASHLAMRGVPLYSIMELLGHSDLKTTQRYAHLSPQTTRSAVQLLDSGQRMGRNAVAGAADGE